MNKKLWQTIGIQKQSQDLGDFSEYSTIKVQEGQPLNDVSQEIHLFVSGPLKNSSQENNTKNVSKQDEVLDVQSCQSIEESPKFKKVQLPLSQTVRELKIIRSAVIDLQSNHTVIKKEYKSKIHQLQQWLQEQIQELVQKISEHFKCSKCENNKRMIDTLTKQCWQFQQQLKKTNEEKEELIQFSKRQQPLREVQEGLLQERGETIRRLTAQVEQLEEENENLKISCSSMQQQLNNVENEYKKHLMSLKANIEQLNYLASTKHDQLVQDKLKLKGQLEDLQQKYHNLLLGTDRSSRSKSKEKHNKSKDIFSISSLSGIYPLVSDLTKPNKNQAPCFVGSRIRPRTQFIPYQSTQDLIQEKKDWKTTSQVHPLSFSTKCENVLNKYNLKRNQNKTFFEGNVKRGITMKTALDSLADLKREVRKEINLSKRY